MRQSTLNRLLDLNRGFYQSFAEPFSQTRGRVQPGVLRALDGLPAKAAVLDLGCGNGSVAAELSQRGHVGVYVGLDSSEGLLALARERAGRTDWQFVEADLAGEDWPARVRQAVEARPPGAGAGTAQSAAGADALPAQPRQGTPGPTPGFQHVFAFAVLHHIPGEQLRTQLLRQSHGLLAPGGRLTLSVWNFLASPRLRRRILPWREAGLAEDDVEPGDYLLDWRRGGRGLRYVHHFTEPELAGLAMAGGFRIVETYLSDGEGGALGRYQVWDRIEGASADSAAGADARR